NCWCIMRERRMHRLLLGTWRPILGDRCLATGSTWRPQGSPLHLFMRLLDVLGLVVGYFSNSELAFCPLVRVVSRFLQVHVVFGQSGRHMPIVQPDPFIAA